MITRAFIATTLLLGMSSVSHAWNPYYPSPFPLPGTGAFYDTLRGSQNGFDAQNGWSVGTPRGASENVNLWQGFRFTARKTGPVQSISLAAAIDSTHSRSATLFVTLHRDWFGLVGAEIDSAKMVTRAVTGIGEVITAMTDYRTTLYAGEQYWIMVEAKPYAVWLASADTANEFDLRSAYSNQGPGRRLRYGEYSPAGFRVE